MGFTVEASLPAVLRICGISTDSRSSRDRCSLADDDSVLESSSGCGLSGSKSINPRASVLKNVTSDPAAIAAAQLNN